MTLQLPDWLRDLTEQLDDAGVEWSFRRSPSLTELAATAGPDLDIWCTTNDARRFIQVLHANGWRIDGGRLVGQPGEPTYSPMLRFRSLYDDRRVVIELAIGALRWQIFVGLDEAGVSRSIARVHGLPFMVGSAELAITITRVVIRGQLKGDRLSRARDLWRSASDSDREEWRVANSALLGEAMTRRVEGWLKGEGEPKPGHGRIATVRAIVRQPSVFRTLASHVLVLTWSRVARVRGPRGAVVSFIGTDGSGKSTTSQHVTDKLTELGIEAHQVYMGRAKGNTRPITAIRSLVVDLLLKGRSGGELTTNHRNASLNSTADSPPNLLWRIAFALAAPVYTLEYWVRFAARVYPFTRRGRHVLIDRGPDDIELMPGPDSAMRALARLGPPRDLVVFCDARPATTVQRKRERTLEAAVRHQAQYQAIADRRARKGRGIRVQTEYADDTSIDLVEQSIFAVASAKSGRLDKKLLRLVVPTETHPKDRAQGDF